MEGETGAGQRTRRAETIDLLGLRDTIAPAAGHLPFGDPAVRSATTAHDPDGDVHAEACGVLHRPPPITGSLSAEGLPQLGTPRAVVTCPRRAGLGQHRHLLQPVRPVRPRRAGRVLAAVLAALYLLLSRRLGGPFTFGGAVKG